MENKKIEFTRVNNDVNGNPRYVCHFTNFLKDGDDEVIKIKFAEYLKQNPFSTTSLLYNLALSRAKKIGGKKFHNKQYGGGIVIQSYNLGTDEKNIFDLLELCK